MINNLLPFMKLVGVGKTGARDLDRESARDAMTALLEGKFHPVTFGAFFMGMRYKGETPEELAGFLNALHRTAIPCATPPPDGLLNCAGAYDGKARTCNIAIPAALVAAATGVPISLHGARNVPTKFGATSGHVLETLGIDISRSLEAVSDDLHTIGIGYVEQQNFHPGLHLLLEMRSHMGKRTILNTMETLSNPFGASSHLGGFFHDPYAELICRAIQTGSTSFTRVTLVKGVEGSDELRPGAMYIARLVNGHYITEPVSSEELGLPAHISELSAPMDSLEERVNHSSRRILEMLDSPAEPSGFRNSVVLNAGIRIYAAGRSSDLKQALETAAEALDSGGAKNVLLRWKTRHSTRFISGVLSHGIQGN